MGNLSLDIEQNLLTLRDNLELLLENSKNEDSEKEAIQDTLQSLYQKFSESNYSNIDLLFRSVITLSDNVSALANGENEALLLRFCLLLEQLVETQKLGADIPRDYFNMFIHLISERELAAESEDSINHASIKILRTLYQRELLALLKNASINETLLRLDEIIADLISELPISMQSEWRTLDFYLKSLKGDSFIEPITHQVLGLLDWKLASILRYKPIDVTFLPELVSAVEQIPNGSRWLQNEKDSKRVYISAGVYSRFVHSIKDQVVALHESVERLYIDKEQVGRLDDSIDFLRELDAILTLMGFEKLSSLAQTIALSFEAWRQNQHNSDLISVNFYEVVNYVWVLEENLNQLWMIDDDDVPITVDDIEGWALSRAHSSIYNQLSIGYEELHASLMNKTIELDDAQISFFEQIKIENFIGKQHLLLSAINQQATALNLNQEQLASLLVSFAYTASRCANRSSIAPSLIEEALKILDLDDTADSTPVRPQMLSTTDDKDQVEDRLVSSISIELKEEPREEFKAEGAVTEELIAEKLIAEKPIEEDLAVSFDDDFDDDIQLGIMAADRGLTDDELTLDKSLSHHIETINTDIDNREVYNADIEKRDIGKVGTEGGLDFDFGSVGLDVEVDNQVDGDLDSSIADFFDDLSNDAEGSLHSFADEKEAFSELDEVHFSSDDDLSLKIELERDVEKRAISDESVKIIEPLLMVDSTLDLNEADVDNIDIEKIDNHSDFENKFLNKPSFDNEIIEDSSKISIENAQENSVPNQNALELELIKEHKVAEDSEDDDKVIDRSIDAKPVASKILLMALSEETDELKEIFVENIAPAKIGKREVQELLRVVHTLKSNVKLIKLDDIFGRLQLLENYLLSLSRCSDGEKATLRNDIEAIFVEVREKIDVELAKSN